MVRRVPAVVKGDRKTALRGRSLLAIVSLQWSWRDHSTWCLESARLDESVLKPAQKAAGKVLSGRRQEQTSNLALDGMAVLALTTWRRMTSGRAGPARITSTHRPDPTYLIAKLQEFANLPDGIDIVAPVFVDDKLNLIAWVADGLGVQLRLTPNRSQLLFDDLVTLPQTLCDKIHSVERKKRTFMCRNLGKVAELLKPVSVAKSQDAATDPKLDKLWDFSNVVLVVIDFHLTAQLYMCQFAGY